MIYHKTPISTERHYSGTLLELEKHHPNGNILSRVELKYQPEISWSPIKRLFRMEHILSKVLANSKKAIFTLKK